MNKVLVILGVLGLAQSSPVEPNVILKEDGSYKFNFDTGKDFGSIVRHEERHPDGTVVGRYSYEHPDGSVRVVNYRAGRQGFIATGDVGVAGAPPAQVPIVIPSIPEQPISEEPDQSIQDPGQDIQEPVTPDVTGVVDKNDVPPHDRRENPPKSDSPYALPKDETIRVAIPDDTGRKREALSPPVSYSDNYFPFEIPTFGKRRLEAPEDEEKTSTDDENEKKENDKSDDQLKPPSSDPTESPKPQNESSGQVHDVPQPNPQGYYFYFPVPEPVRFLPGNKPHSAPSNQHHPGVPSVWAYVPITSFSPQNSPAPQPFMPPRNWGYAQSHAVNYIPNEKDDVQVHGGALSAPHAPPPPGVSDGPGAQSHIPSIHQNPTHGLVAGNTSPVQENPTVPVSVDVPQGQIQPAFNRPTVHHYNYRGPSNSYGYYYHY